MQGHVRSSASAAAPDCAPAVRQSSPSSVGRRLPPTLRAAAERLLDARLPDVRVHSGAESSDAARALGLRAFTVGRDVVLGAGLSRLDHPSSFSILAHELAHTLQQRSAVPRVVDPASREHELEVDAEAALRTPGGAPMADALRYQAVQGFPPGHTPIPSHIVRLLLGQDVVFIMGSDRGGFYTYAERYYRAHVPGATFVTDVRTLDGVLAWVRDHVTHFVNQLYIVSHANEDGTLSFGLDAADANAHVDVNELREALHPTGGGQSTLADASARIDQFSRIHIKGCDLGRTPSIVELIDEAFGGQGTVTAPTHEQMYGVDPTLGAQARSDFNRGISDSHAMPEEIDPSLRGAERATAIRERRTALAARRRAISAEQAGRRGEADAIAEQAQTYEALSGPMFQRPGSRLFTAAEIRPEVDRLYGHLSDAQRASLVQRLLTPDRRNPAVAHRQGVFQQQGIRAYRYEPFSITFSDPITDAQRVQTFAQLIRDTTGADVRRFTVTSSSTTRVPSGNGFFVRTQLVGTTRGNPQEFRFDGTVPDVTNGEEPIPGEAAIVELGRRQRPNPDRYTWSVQETRSGTQVTRRAVAQRVVAYLHHGSLDASRHDHFTRPLTDRDFFAESTFVPQAAVGAPRP